MGTNGLKSKSQRFSKRTKHFLSVTFICGFDAYIDVKSPKVDDNNLSLIFTIKVSINMINQ